MKKIKAISILFAALIMITAFASCSEVKDFTKIKYAKEATQTLTITDGETVVYSEERVYKDYIVTIKTKKLSDNMYEESFEESETTKSYDKVPERKTTRAARLKKTATFLNSMWRKEG